MGQLGHVTPCGRKLCKRQCSSKTIQTLTKNPLKAIKCTLSEDLEMQQFKNSREIYMVLASYQLTADDEGQSQRQNADLKGPLYLFLRNYSEVVGKDEVHLTSLS